MSPESRPSAARSPTGSPCRSEAPRTELGILLGGGGARAAYQVGVLRALAESCPEMAPPFLGGVSAGSINVAFLANQEMGLAAATDGLRALWAGLDITHVIETGLFRVVGRMLGAAVHLSIGTPPGSRRARSMVDNRPLRAFLSDALKVGDDGRLPGVEANLAAGRLRGVGITTFCFTRGRTVTFVAGPEVTPWERPRRESRTVRLGLDHVMASAALPLLFPPVRIDTCWYGDGGIRLVAPLGPILHLGAGRILAISTHFTGSDAEASVTQDEAPSPALILASLYNHIFNDELDQDLRHLERVNRLLRHVPVEERMGLREVDLMVVRPSENLGEMAREHEARLPRTLRFFLRRFGTDQARSHDFLSTLMFDPAYVARLIELGERDGRARSRELADFVRGPAPTGRP